MDALVQQICASRRWPLVHAAGGGYRIEVPTQPGRSQVVEITNGLDPDGRRLAYIWSVVCGVHSIGDPYYLLRQNAQLHYGALAIKDPNVILMETQLVESADAEEVTRAIYYVAKNADELEKQVHGAIDHN